jgi:hypothetical protein
MTLKVTTTARPTINTTVKKVSLPLVNLEELKNVDSNDLEDGYTIVYDASTNTWITQAFSGLSVGNIDGGTF